MSLSAGICTGVLLASGPLKKTTAKRSLTQEERIASGALVYEVPDVKAEISCGSSNHQQLLPKLKTNPKALTQIHLMNSFIPRIVVASLFAVFKHADFCVTSKKYLFNYC
jgi:hypothetical protein